MRPETRTEDSGWTHSRACLGAPRVGPFKLLMVLERHGRRDVYYAVDEQGAEAALELHPAPEGAADGDPGLRLERTAKALSDLRHPGLPALVGRGWTAEGLHWLALELVEGRDVASLVGARRPPRLSVLEALHVTGRVAAAVAALHARGVAHGTCDARSVLVTPAGAVRLGDLGAALRPGPPAPTADDPPEASEPGLPTLPGDVWRLSCLAARLLGALGERDDLPAGGRLVLDGYGAALPAQARAALEGAAALDPGARPTMAELADALDPFAQDVEVQAALRREARRRVASGDVAWGPLAVGDRFGRYLIEEELGRGGMGVVYRARHEVLDADVALKVLQPGLLASDTVRARFLREAQLGATLQHPSVVPVLDAGRQDGLDYIAMELVEGEPLRDALLGADRRELVRLLAGVCEGVHHAHVRGVVHRDLKPENVLVDQQGKPRILDFGVARRVTPDGATLTTEGAWVGTLRYMAPEQVSDPQTVDVRSDVYGLGTMLYEALTGQAPHEDPNLALLLQRKQDADPPPPRELDRTVPPELDAICMRALERDPEARYQSALELKRELHRYLSGEPVLALEVGAARRVQRALRRHRRLAATVGAAGLLLAGAWGLRAGLEASRHRALADRVGGLVARGLLALERGRPDDAAARLELAAALLGERAVPHSVHGRLDAVRLREWLAAARAAKARARADGLLRRGEAALAEARDWVLEAGPSYPWLFGAGEVDHEARRASLTQARSLLEEAQRLDGERVDVRDALAATYAELGKLEEVEALRRFRVQRRAEANRHVEQGRRLLDEGALERARGAFERALGLDGASAMARQGLREVERRLVERANREAARERGRRALALLEAAREALSRGSVQEARSYLQQARAVAGVPAEEGSWASICRAAAAAQPEHERHARLGEAERSLGEVHRALAAAQGAFTRGELPGVVREAYFEALEAAARAVALLPQHEPSVEALVRVGAETAAVLAEQGRTEQADALRSALGVEDVAVELPYDPHLVVTEVDRVVAARALGGGVEFLPSHAFDALRRLVARRAPSCRIRVEVRTDVDRDASRARLLLRRLVVRCEDRAAGTVSPPRAVEVDGHVVRRVVVGPDGVRAVRPWEESDPIDVQALVGRVHQTATGLLEALASSGS